MRVYVAGPYSQGDQAANVRAAIDAADKLAAAGHVPYIPHLTHFWHLVTPRPYQWWLDYDAQWLACCDAVLRLPGRSAGADEEVALAAELGIPVYGGNPRVRTATDVDILIGCMDTRLLAAEAVACHNTRLGWTDPEKAEPETG